LKIDSVKTMKDRGTLEVREPHPCAEIAMEYIRSQHSTQLSTLRESLASCAIESNRLAEVCLGTLDRLLLGETVSDRYLLGLAWFMREYELGIVKEEGQEW